MNTERLYKATNLILLVITLVVFLMFSFKQISTIPFFVLMGVLALVSFYVLPYIKEKYL